MISLTDIYILLTKLIKDLMSTNYSLIYKETDLQFSALPIIQLYDLFYT